MGNLPYQSYKAKYIKAYQHFSFFFFFWIVLFSFPYLVFLYLNKLSPTIHSGGEHREADCFYKYSKWEGGDGLPPGHSASRTQSG